MSGKGLVIGSARMPGAGYTKETLKSPAEESYSQPSDTPSSSSSISEKTKPEVSVSLWPSSHRNLGLLEELIAENIEVKIWATALPALNKSMPPDRFPEYTDPKTNRYVYSPLDFWTSGFFPGTLYLLHQRSLRHPSTTKLHPARLFAAARWWAESLTTQASRTDSHDLGFMIQPSFQPHFELTGDKGSFETLVTAAKSLASRYDDRVGAIRSWDACKTGRYAFEDKTKDYLVIIDNMLNLDIMFYVASKTGDLTLSAIATQHAKTTLKHHVRDNWSTVHMVNFDQRTGAVKEKITNQGYWDDSTWSRGQAWGVLGFAQVYGWTKQKEFLDAAKKLARYFLGRLPEDGVPHWDFDAPRPTHRDTSAAMICASGLLEIYKHCENPLEKAEWLHAATWVVGSTLRLSLSPRAKFLVDGGVDAGEFDTILMNATINCHEHAQRRWADHGLVYADYYIVQVGNKFLDLGLLRR
ncbi:Six-hairpin glycosidase [Choiromyces venosus 120613-1]|uniref:Six-hairpin glycosidase n=1 Tax=Choiromyces venosus 120613-1 TaxID=1336337 RepID=A0A3N4JQF5_9PEZI|nr:Six-hairpin glycosidase [Choiromyces venosus 120613-1]